MDDGGTCSEPIPEQLKRWRELVVLANRANRQLVEAVALAYGVARMQRECVPMMPPVWDVPCRDDEPDEGVCRG